ncbi:NAD-dependent epimerase/dehydratase family protein [Streptomyces roseirectus]|uniref:NAD-dependent epimerase/dehydratase family protein n=1 Tax=Streptomyces roseirectus TaxID=2768066 RepID=A0A7H0IPW1_9ACTN|nr:NAD-dependent epimerase/dehydratase family protein [Streptomyces roseirectus]QNP74827.1 NAD-dependent epimerase/dehydratase family protein [Streptomyces roseirectus]
MPVPPHATAATARTTTTGPPATDAPTPVETEAEPTEDSVHTRLDKLRGTRVVVTGGAGLVGSRLVALLHATGATVTVLDRMDAYPESGHETFGVARAGARLVVGDVRDAGTVGPLLRNADFVVHAAAYADVAACTRRPDLAFRSNVEGTQVVLEQTARFPVRRLVLVSSASVYGDGLPGVEGPQAFHEDQPLFPMSVYANSKLWAEHQTRLMLGASARTEYAVVRYFSVYGEPQIPKPDSHSWMVPWLSLQARLGRPMRLNGGGVQVRDLVHVDDIAEATALALTEERMAGRTVNVGTGRPTSVREVADLIAPYFPGARRIVTPRPEGDPLGGYAATERCRDLLRWQARIPVEKGVERYVRWLLETPDATPRWFARQTHGA